MRRPESIPYRGLRLIPPGTRKNNHYWLLRGTRYRQYIERSLATTELDEARRAADEILAAMPFRASSAYIVSPDTAELPGWGLKIMDAARWRSTKSGTPFSLSKEDMLALVKRANGRCMLTGIEFSSQRSNQPASRRSRRRPFGPSLDRIVPDRGYNAENCRLVIFALNVAMSDWGENVFRQVAARYLRNRDPSFILGALLGEDDPNLL